MRKVIFIWVLGIGIGSILNSLAHAADVTYIKKNPCRMAIGTNPTIPNAQPKGNFSPSEQYVYPASSCAWTDNSGNPSQTWNKIAGQASNLSIQLQTIIRGEAYFPPGTDPANWIGIFQSYMTFFHQLWSMNTEMIMGYRFQQMSMCNNSLNGHQSLIFESLSDGGILVRCENHRTDSITPVAADYAAVSNFDPSNPGNNMIWLLQTSQGGGTLNAGAYAYALGIKDSPSSYFTEAEAQELMALGWLKEMVTRKWTLEITGTGTQ